MEPFEKLVDEIASYGAFVVEKPFKSNAKALIKGQKIGIREGLSRVEKVCALAEEMGHYFTNTGNILDQSDVGNRRQELRARRWAHRRLIEFDELILAKFAGVRNRYELAMYLGVTEAFLEEALDHFEQKHGLYIDHNGYRILFDPLDVYKLS